MLSGTADAATLARDLDAPAIASWRKEPVELRDVLTLQVVAEIRRDARAMLLPPGLHPTDPTTLSIQAWHAADSDAGAFAVCLTRLSCRSGVRARGFTTAAVVDGETAAARLRDQYGFPCRSGEVRLRKHYDACTLTVAENGRDILAVNGLDPDPLDPDDVQYTGTMNLADTPNGLRLVQVESHHHGESVERVAARIETFVADAWGDARFDPYYVVTTTIARAESVTLPPVRFVCRADVSAFEGTEPVS
jgi:hypothetical protein